MNDKRFLGKLVALMDLFALRIPEDSSLITSDYRRDLLRNRLHRLPYLYGLRMVSRLARGRPTLITDRPWDTLIILDACRYDIFMAYWRPRAKSHNLESNVPSVTSPASHTKDWVFANFVRNPEKGTLQDAIIVTANPYSSKRFFDMNGWTFPLAGCVDVWVDFWKTDLKIVKPEMVYLAAMKASERHAGRLIVHFIQPHFPYLGALDIGNQQIFDDRYAPGIWGRIKTGDIPVDMAMALYLENLVLAMRWAMKLAESSDGRVVITADHGNLFGEYGLYWHPPKLYAPELVTVPWLEIEGGISSHEDPPSQ